MFASTGPDGTIIKPRDTSDGWVGLALPEGRKECVHCEGRLRAGEIIVLDAEGLGYHVKCAISWDYVPDDVEAMVLVLISTYTC